MSLLFQAYFICRSYVSFGLYRRSDFNQVPVGIIEPDYLLSPTVCHQMIDIFGFGVENLKSLCKLFYFRLFKI